MCSFGIIFLAFSSFLCPYVNCCTSGGTVASPKLYSGSFGEDLLCQWAPALPAGHGEVALLANTCSAVACVPSIAAVPVTRAEEFVAAVMAV